MHVILLLPSSIADPSVKHCFSFKILSQLVSISLHSPFDPDDDDDIHTHPVSSTSSEKSKHCSEFLISSHFTSSCYIFVVYLMYK
jgi:hypothetical protein